MGDKRTDPGHYYPGGRVRAKSGTAPQELIVQWSDVQGKPQIAPLPDRYKDSDVKGKINEIASKFATVVVAALIGWTACADITVQKKRKDQIYNDEQVVVDVSGDGVGMNTNNVIDIANATIATNPVVAAKLDGPTDKYLSEEGKPADAKEVGDRIEQLDLRLIDVENDKLDGPTVEPGPSGMGHAADAKDVYDSLQQKADRAGSGDDGELATLDEDGNPTRSGISAFGGNIEANGYVFSRGDNAEVFSEGIVDALGEIKIVDGETGDTLHALSEKADRSMISATNQTFAAEVLAVQVAGLSTNITAEVYIAATNACANLGIDPALIPGDGTIGTVGGFIAMLFAVVFWMRKKIFDNSGKVTDAFAGDLMQKQVAKEAVRYAFDLPTSSTTTTGTVETTAVTADSNTVASVTIPAAASGNTPSLAITVPDALGSSDVRDLIVYAVNADTANDCPIGIVGGTPVPQDGADTKVPKGSRVYIAISKMPTTGEWFIQAVKLTAAA